MAIMKLNSRRRVSWLGGFDSTTKDYHPLHDCHTFLLRFLVICNLIIVKIDPHNVCD